MRELMRLKETEKSELERVALNKSEFGQGGDDKRKTKSNFWNS